jgi:acid phosphatase type 7
MKTRNRNLKAAAFILIAAIIVSAFPAFAAAEAVSTPENLTLSLTGNSSEIAVTWWNDANETSGEVRYGADRTLAHCLTASAIRVFTRGGYSVFEGKMTGLIPEAVYYYQVVNNKETSPVKRFKTPENNLQSFSFLYLGDVQTDQTGTLKSDKSYAAWGALLKKARQNNPDLSFGLQGGDLVENGTQMNEWNMLLKNADSVFSEIPLMPTNGNHDSNFPSGKPELYLKLFSLPQNGPEGFKEEFYSFDYGSSHIVVLNSWVFSGEQRMTAGNYAAIKAWITKDLESSSAVWKIVVTHLPAYSLCSDVNANAVKKNWAPLFEQYGVDLVLVGHQHVYSRSFPMYQGRIDYEKGVTYIMGDSGPKFYSTADERYSEKVIYNTSTYQVVHIDGSTMEVLTFDARGNELDYWSATARAGRGSAISALPVPGSPYLSDQWFRCPFRS